MLAVLDWLLYLARGDRCPWCHDRYRDPVRLEAHAIIDHAGDRP